MKAAAHVMDVAVDAVTKNYFELFELPVSYAIDQEVLDSRFMKLQKSVHPDASDDDSLSVVVNKAYSTLSDPIQRAEYVMRITGCSEKFDGITYVTPALFELSERISSTDVDQSAEARKLLVDMQQDIYSTLLRLFTTTLDEKLIFEQIYKAKYIRRILES